MRKIIILLVILITCELSSHDQTFYGFSNAQKILIGKWECKNYMGSLFGQGTAVRAYSFMSDMPLLCYYDTISYDWGAEKKVHTNFGIFNYNCDYSFELNKYEMPGLAKHFFIDSISKDYKNFYFTIDTLTCQGEFYDMETYSIKIVDSNKFIEVINNAYMKNTIENVWERVELE